MENFHGDKLNPHNINKPNCTHQSLQEIQHLYHFEHCLIFVGPEHQSSKIYHAFSNYVKTTFNNGLSFSEVDLSHPKRETRNHGSNLMEVDWGGNIDPNYSSSGCMLMQVDFRVNHINECMPSEVDWGAHETHQNGHSITKVDWGAHDSSLFLYLVHIDHDAKPKDFFTQGLWGGLPQRTSSTPLMEYLKESLDTGQIEDGFPNSNQSRGTEVHTLFLILNNMKVAYNLLTEWDPGEKTLKPQTINMADFQLCGNLKTRFVINGYLTKEPIEIVHSGAELNNFQLPGADDEMNTFKHR